MRNDERERGEVERGTGTSRSLVKRRKQCIREREFDLKEGRRGKRGPGCLKEYNWGRCEVVAIVGELGE